MSSNPKFLKMLILQYFLEISRGMSICTMQLPKLKRRVRFPYPAPNKETTPMGGFFIWQAGWESKRREHTKCAEENSPVDCFRRRGRVGGGSRRSDSAYPAPKTEGSAKADPSVFGKVGIETNSDFA